jgi:hypothetical protein
MNCNEAEHWRVAKINDFPVSIIKWNSQQMKSQWTEPFTYKKIKEWGTSF